MITEIKKDGKTYVHDTDNDGYYGVRVKPGSRLDTTQGNIGIHWVCLQYARSSKLTKTLGELASEFDKIEREPKKPEVVAKPVIANRPGLCPRCHTYCDGDCQALSSSKLIKTNIFIFNHDGA